MPRSACAGGAVLVCALITVACENPVAPLANSTAVGGLVGVDACAIQTFAHRCDDPLRVGRTATVPDTAQAHRVDR